MERVGRPAVRRTELQTDVLDDETIQVDLENRLLEPLGMDFEAEEL
jgi:hypothetical protein